MHEATPFDSTDDSLFSLKDAFRHKKRKDRSSTEVPKVPETPKRNPTVRLADRLVHEEESHSVSSRSTSSSSEGIIRSSYDSFSSRSSVSSGRTKLEEHEREKRRYSEESIPDLEPDDKVNAVPRVQGWLYDIGGELLALIDSHTSIIKVRGMELDVQVKESGLVLSRSSITDNRDSCISTCMQQNEEEISALRIDLAAKEQEIQQLTLQIQDGGGDFESTGVQLTRVLGLKGQQIKRLQKLEQTVTVRYQREKSKMSVQLLPGLFTMAPFLCPHPVLWCEALPEMSEEKVLEPVEEEVSREITPEANRVPSSPSTFALSDAVRSRSDAKRKQLNVATTIHLSNLPYVSTEEEVKTWFERCGDIERVLLPVFSDTQKRRGYGFVEFSTPAAAINALELDGLEQHGRVVRVNFANAATKSGHAAKKIAVDVKATPPREERRPKEQKQSKQSKKATKQQKGQSHC